MLHFSQGLDDLNAIAAIHALAQYRDLLLKLILGGGPFNDLLKDGSSCARGCWLFWWTLDCVDFASIRLLQDGDARLFGYPRDELLGDGLQQRRLPRPILANEGISLAGLEPEFRIGENLIAFGGFCGFSFALSSRRLSCSWAGGDGDVQPLDVQLRRQGSSAFKSGITGKVAADLSIVWVVDVEASLFT